MEKPKTGPSPFDLLKFPGSFWPFGKKKKGKRETEEEKDEELYSLYQARENWKKALQKKKDGQFDMSTLHFRKSLEMLIKASCPGYVSPAERNLLNLSKKAFPTLPEEIRSAITFLNPHYTLVKSVYTSDFADEVHEQARLVAEWIFSQSSKLKRFELDPR